MSHFGEILGSALGSATDFPHSTDDLLKFKMSAAAENRASLCLSPKTE
jgi:hypothetical protein